MQAAARLWRLRGPAALGLAAAAAAAARAAGDAAPQRAAPVDAASLPAPGSYRLPRIMAAPDGNVLTVDGSRRRLHDLLRGRISVLAFMYTYCRDAEGCPRALAVMEAARSALAGDAALARTAQLVSLSFDPSNDTPQAMRLYGGNLAADARVRWHFLTTASVAELLPLLRGFGQDVSIELDDRGRPTRTLNHLLKVFLVDAAAQVREIYSVATLDPRALVNDLRTLQRERGG